MDYDLDNFEKKNPPLFAKFYSPNFENPQLFKNQHELTNRIEDLPSPFRSPCFTPTFMRSSTPMKSIGSGAKSIPFKPPSRSQSVGSRPPSTSSQIGGSKQNDLVNNEKSGQNIDDDVELVSEFHPQKISTQGQRRFKPYQPAHSTATCKVKTETEPRTVAEIIRSQAISQTIRSSSPPIVKAEPDDDVQFSFEFHPQKISTQLPKNSQKMAPPSFRPPQKPACKVESQTVQERIMNTQPTVADLIRTEAIKESQTTTQIACSHSSAPKIETPDDDVQFSFEFHPRKMSTQISCGTNIQPSFRPPDLTMKTETQTVIQRIIKTTTSQIITQPAANSVANNGSAVNINNSMDTFNQNDYSTSDDEGEEDFDLFVIPNLEDGGSFSPFISPESSQKSQRSQQDVEWNSLLHDQSRNLFSTQKTNEISSQ